MRSVRSIRFAPSLLSADAADLRAEVAAMEAAGGDLIHIDVMDGHFVPGLTFGPGTVKALRRHTKKPLDVHLMVETPEAHLAAFAEAGADALTVHAEAGPHLHGVLRSIRALGCRAGVALNPGTPPSALDCVLEEVDLVLVLLVNPGLPGQSMLPSQLAKVRELRRRLDVMGRRAVDIEVDGGISIETAPSAVAAGADILVAGTAAFAGGPTRYATNLETLRRSVENTIPVA